MPLYNPNLGTQRPELADALYEYQPDNIGFIADAVAPRMDVGEAAGNLEVVTRESMLQIPADERRPNGEYAELSMYLDKVAYTTTDRGLTYTIKDGDRSTIQLNHELAAMRMLKSSLMRARDKRVIDTLFSTSTWTGAALLTTAATPWTTAATADPITNVIAAKKKVRDATGVEPNALVLSALNLDRLIQCTIIRDAAKYTTMPTVAELTAALPALLGVQKLIVSKSMYDANPEGKSANPTSQMTDLYVQVAVIGNENDPVSPSVMFTPTFIEDGGLPYVVESWQSNEKRGLVYRVRNHVGELLVDKYFAHMIKVAS